MSNDWQVRLAAAVAVHKRRRELRAQVRRLLERSSNPSRLQPMNDDEPRWSDRVVELRRERREKVLELRGEGMTQREIADALGCAIGTVNADLTGDEDSAAEVALAAVVATPTRTPVPVERLRSGSLPDSAPAADEVDAGRLADRILRRPW